MDCLGIVSLEQFIVGPGRDEACASLHTLIWRADMAQPRQLGQA